ncbi:hypothetical protein SAMN05720473_101386 [Fibrobacter sp. UWB15]|jgi:hypothetical protein|uniref:hypothetical protein n=1 Tax=unclassified Fibrobacter TaxID=2634177 RepID=UPI00091C6FE1|nr:MULTISPECIES: hypothetical protein [unclassified Fibrobacter]PWJ67513.1 hypothetical protein BGW99_101386 [Fibrobacter sp. UWB6]SHF69583.1 hypothetical protein SAMN05720760_101351 [Fibrobacter sp. UWB8]SMG11616.1 hypothetical protein SAMN05720473_101386 [Fibrobacter sp. UWB15]
MSEIHINCPHCGVSFDAQLHGDSANMMVFCCARCKTPLMYYHGEVAELDREEFAGLRKKLSRAIDAVVSNGGAMGAVAEALKKMVDASEALAEERTEKGENLPSPREGSAPSEFENVAEKIAGAMASNDAEKVQPAVISDDVLADLQKDLDELDVDSFLDKL